jgi:hypothetical protein
MDHELGQVKNMKLLLNDIEQLPELKLIFYYKSEILCFGEAKHYEQECIIVQKLSPMTV